jgi:hypothetical protein
MLLTAVTAARGSAPIPKCDDCDDEANPEANPADATHWCPKCELFFCASCARPHLTKKVWIPHKIQTIEEHRTVTGGTHSSSNGATKECQLHHKPHEFYCRSCHAIGCSTCIITGHKDHIQDTGLLDEMVGPLLAELKESGISLSDYCTAMHVAMDGVQTTLTALNQNEAVALAAAERAKKELGRAATTAFKETEAEVGTTTLCLPQSNVDPCYFSSINDALARAQTHPSPLPPDTVCLVSLLPALFLATS